MEDKKPEIKNNRRGMTLVIAVVIVVVLALIGVGLIQLGRNARLQAVKDVLQISARSAADAGIEHAMRYMIDQWNAATNKYTWVNTTWYGATGAAVKFTYPASGYLSMGDTFGDAKFKYKIYKGTRPAGYQIISTGTAAGVTRIVHATVLLRSVFFGIGAKESLYIYPNTKLGTVPDNSVFIIQTNSIKPDVIQIKPNITVPGDVVCGPGGDPDITINTGSNVVIEGESRPSEDYIDFPSIYVPGYLSSLPYGSPTINASDKSIAYIYGNIKLNGLQFGSGSLKRVNTLYIQGNVEVFVDGSTSLNSGSKIIVKDGSLLRLYLGGNMEAKSGSTITYEGMPTNPDPVVYKNLIIEAASSIIIKGTVASDGTPLCTNINLFPDGDFYGAVYAPDASLTLKPGDNFYGAIVGGNNINLQPRGTFMFIPSLVDLPDVDVLYIGLKHGSWWEE